MKYLSEIITARIEEIMMAILYEINESGFADMLRSGIVVTGGCAQTANLSNFINELSGYRVRTGYPHARFSSTYDGTADTTAATSIGLIMAAKDELGMTGYTIPEPGTEGINIFADPDETETAPAPETEEPEVREMPDNGELFRDDEIEKVVPPKKEKKNLFNVFWSKAKKVTEEAKEKTGSWLDELSEEEV